MVKKGKVFIISGPSGSGKTTLYKKLLKDDKFKRKLVKSISVTTRAKREGEVQGRDYCFVSPKMFLYKKSAGHFLENMKVFDNYYGTPQKGVKDLLAKGKNVLLCIDVQGERVVSRKMKNVVTIFVKTPSLQELKKRLLARGSENEKTLRLRLDTAKKELQESSHYDYVITNDNLNRAYAQILGIIRQEIEG